MNASDYERAIRESLDRFRRPGEQLEVVEWFTAQSDRQVPCDLCRWPYSSKTTLANGLRKVLVVQNNVTRHKLYVGRKCAKWCQSYIQRTEPEFRLLRLDEAIEALTESGFEVSDDFLGSYISF